MAEQRDIYDNAGKVEKKVRAIESSKISKRNKKLIFDFKSYCEAQNLSASRVLKYLWGLQNLAGWFGKDFDKATKKDLEGLVGKINGMNYEEATKRDYKVCLKKFYKWLNGGETYPETVRWLKLSIGKNKTKLPKDMLTEDEVKALVDAAKNPRDKALVSTLYESGCRVGELLGLKIKDVSFDDLGTTIVVGGKTGERVLRLVRSAAYLAAWLESHSFKHDREAFLWVNIEKRSLKAAGRKQGEEAAGYGPLEHAALTQVLRRLAESIGLQKKTNPHIFRHSRATELAKFMTEQEMKRYFGWTNASEMAAVYVHLSGKDIEGKVLEINGLRKPEARIKNGARECPRCKFPNPSEIRFCGRCGSPLDFETLQYAEKLQNKAGELLALFAKYPKRTDEILDRLEKIVKK